MTAKRHRAGSQASPEVLGRTITGLVPMGDSAGGNLAIVVTQALAESWPPCPWCCKCRSIR